MPETSYTIKMKASYVVSTNPSLEELITKACFCYYRQGEESFRRPLRVMRLRDDQNCVMWVLHHAIGREEPTHNIYATIHAG